MNDLLTVTQGSECLGTMEGGVKVDLAQTSGQVLVSVLLPFFREQTAVGRILKLEPDIGSVPRLSHFTCIGGDKDSHPYHHSESAPCAGACHPRWPCLQLCEAGTW